MPRMPQPDETQGLLPVITALNEQLQLLTDLCRKLLDAQIQTARNVHELSTGIQKSLGDSCDAQVKVGEVLIKMNESISRCFAELFEKLGLTSSAAPFPSSPPKQGSGTIQ